VPAKPLSTAGNRQTKGECIDPARDVRVVRAPLWHGALGPARQREGRGGHRGQLASGVFRPLNPSKAKKKKKGSKGSKALGAKGEARPGKL